MAGLPKKYAKMGFKKGWAAYKRAHPKKRSSSTKKRSKPTTKRRRKTVAKRRTTRRKKYTTVSVMALGQAAMQFSNITKQPLGDVVNDVVIGAINGDEDVIAKVLDVGRGALDNITTNPVGIAIRAGIIAFLFAQGKKIIGHKTIFKVGSFRLTM